MLKLFIDNNEIALDEDFRLEVHRENPLFTKTGDYTYNIDIDLNVPQNSRVYSGIKRIGSHYSVKNRTARLVDGIYTLLQGPEIILSLTGSSASIQIVNNYSALNYLSTSDKRSIRDLDFGFVDVVSAAVKTASKNKIFPAAKYTFPPMLQGDGLTVINKGLPVYDSGFVYDDDASQRGCPFVLYLIERLLEVLGYSVTYNCLRDTKWERLVLCHGYDTNSISQMLPDWDVATFLSEVEKFFNVIFFVDSSNAKVSIVNVKSFYSSSSVHYVDSSFVLDSFDRDFSSDGINGFFVSYDSVDYALSGENGMQYADIDHEILDKSIYVNASYEEVSKETYPSFYEKYDDWRIFRDTNRSNLFFKPIKLDDGSYSKVRLNAFGKFIRYADGSAVTLKIIPALITDVEWEVKRDNVVTNGQGVALVPRVYLNDQSEFGFYETLAGQTRHTEDVMRVAFYHGDISLRKTSSTYNTYYSMPMCWNSEYTVGSFKYPWKIQQEELRGAAEMTLELDGHNRRGELEFDNKLSLDFNQCYNISFLTDEFLDPTHIFIISGVKFACKKLVYVWEHLSNTRLVRGEFYRFK